MDEMQTPTWPERKKSGGPSRTLVGGQALKDAITAARLSQEQLAKRAGCSKAFVGFLCTGVRDSATGALAEAIEDALGVERGGLFPAVEAPAEVGT